MNQDTQQKLYSFGYLMMELYGITSSCLLLLFVQRNCQNSIYQNLLFKNHTYNACLCFNFFTFLSFLFLYGIEVTREYYFIKFLNVNIKISNSDSDVERQLLRISPFIKNKITYINNIYKRYCFYILLLFITNTILSFIVIFEPNIILSFLINIVAMINKLENMYIITNSPNHIFYSAYIKSRLQYNDVDPSLTCDHGLDC